MRIVPLKFPPHPQSREKRRSGTPKASVGRDEGHCGSTRSDGDRGQLTADDLGCHSSAR